MDTAVAIADQPQRKPRALTVTGKVKAAISAMVWQGMKRAEAAQIAGLVEQSLYVALRRPHVKAFYLSELEVLRTSERARNIHSLVAVRDQTDNQMARVQAVKALEQLGDDAATNAQRSQAPGIVIMIGAPANAAVAVTSHDGELDAKPLIEHENE